MKRVEILWADEDGNPQVAPATMEDRSDGGFGVRLNKSIRAGSHVTLKWGSEQASGTVTNCRRENTDYVIGVKRESVEARDRK